ncbi:acyltransferase family protein [Kitasatospora sp. NPDC056327]|uniref:acyltransferase family protein n=1 Tax=Kitasatospora sp. NPDC056327 TaxID=3345785 RepID=UPI0035D6CCA6
MSTDEINAVRPAAGRTAQPPAPAGHPEPPARPRGSLAGRLPSLTGLRFPAALLVFVFHASLPYDSVRLLADDAAQKRFTDLSAQTGALGVTFFFALSGFVLTWSAREGDTARAFWRRRYVKIVPNYVVAWALALLLFAGATTEAWRAALNLLMLQVYVPDFLTNFSVNPPGWSLAAEAVFYLCFPLLHLWIKRIQADRLKYWIAGTVAGIVATVAVAYTVVPAGTAMMDNEPTTSATQYWFAYVLPFPRLLDFALGILVARAVMAGRWRNIGMVWSSVLLAASFVAASYVPHIWGQRAVTVVPAVLLIAAGAIADNEGRPSAVRNRVMVWLGEVSFAFYLLHYVVIATTRRVLGAGLYSGPATVALLVVEFVITLLASWALYALVERPITRRWSRPRKRAGAPAPQGG